MLKDFVNNLVAQALDRAKEKGGLTLAVPPNIVIEEPRDESMGDFATTIAMQLAKSEKKNPKVIAELIAEGIREQKEWVESVNVAASSSAWNLSKFPVGFSLKPSIRFGGRKVVPVATRAFGPSSFSTAA